MKAEIISVGTELLLGNIVNTNATYLAERCAEYGLYLFNEQVVGDNALRLKDSFETALSRSDVIFTSGGLGPTNDDITKEVICEALGLELQEDEASKKAMFDYFEKLGRKNVPEINNKQYMIPVGGRALINKKGTAPAVFIETDDTTAKDKYPGKVIILLPGPPRELKPLVEEYVTPYFMSKREDVIYSKMVKLCGIGESSVAAQIGDILENSVNPTVSPYAKSYEVHLRITALAKTEKEAMEMIEPVYKKIEEKLGRYIYSFEKDETLEEAVISLARDNTIRISTAESCTGGLLSGRLINVSGASDCFDMGFVTYSNEAKNEILGVDENILREYGAVSSECAKAMAQGAYERSGADLCISVTGIAGPDGGTEKKPVGLVYIGSYYKGTLNATEFNMAGDRQMIRDASVARALDMMRKLILGIE